MSYQMPDPAAAPRRPAGGRRRGGAIVPTVVVLVVLLAVFGLFTGVYTDLLWFRSVGFTEVFTTQLLVKTVMFVVFGLVFAAAIGSSFVIGYRTRPFYVPTGDMANLERYRQNLEPFRRIVVIGTCALLGLLAGSTAAGQWQTFELWRHGGSFGTKDPQFGKDVGFFVFDLPFYRFLVSFLFATVLVALIAAAVTHYLYGGLRLQGPGERTSNAARVHLSVLLGLFVLLKAVAYWLDRFGLETKDGRVGRTSFVGATYTDVNAVLPAKNILMVIAVICAVLFFANIVYRRWVLAGVGVVLLLLSAIVIGGLYPLVVQQFSVKPSEQAKESAYIARNIAGTRAAFDIADSEQQDYAATTTATAGQLRDDAATIPGIRLLDPAIVSPTFRQLQQVRGYYGFPDVLDVDRYTLDGKEQDSVVSVRDIDLGGLPAGQRNWINDHLVYTHGFGFVAARGNTRESDGKPSFFESNIPPSGALGDFEPRVYFGENSPTYSIVGGTSSEPRELDYPSNDANGQVFNSYAGKGGVPIGGFFNKLVYAVKYQEGNILLSNLINPGSKILYNRDPRDRVEKVAPWLTLDGNIYPAVVNGRITWILDGYTTSNSYPYSTRTSLQRATEDSLTQGSSAVVTQVDQQANYIRNSVKATVDAYDGTVTLYAWDDADPLLKAWSKTFPGTVKPRSAISPELLKHLRYPEDLFKVQRTLLAKYHVTDPQAFYTGQDFWRVPNDPTTSGSPVEQPPYYLTVRMPGQDKPAFSLTTTFVPNGDRDNLTALAAVDAEPGPDYGKIRVLVVPRNTTISGPGQVQNNFEANPTVSQTLSLLRRGGSDVVNGNLLTLPVGGGLLYVEPVYVRAAAGGTSYPLLQKVLVAFGDKIGFDDTLQGALNQVFQGNAGTTTNEPGTGEGGATPSPTPSPTSSGGTGTPGTQSGQLAQALADMQKAVSDAKAALAAGDFAAYGKAQQDLQNALDRAVAAEQGQGSTPSPSPSPSGSSGAAAQATPTPTPSTAGG
ncbi:MAG TPA: UPF0182 family protein [Motilibacteraceae bacterium]|nr:UPF0182 family protein [Motilibacteraceae bacterium]